VLFEDTLVLSIDHHGDSFVIALDARSGGELWRRPRATGPGWCSPLVFEVEGRPVVVVGAGRTVAYDLATGEELWSFGEPGGRGDTGTIASPVHAATADRAAGVVIAVRETELVALDAATGEALWRQRGGPQVPSPLVHDGRVLALRSNTGVLTALALESGATLRGPLRLDGAEQVFASPIAAADHLYVLARNGTTTVLDLASGAVVARNELDDAFVASPAASRGELYLRGFASLYCIAGN
jgi:outer membrane protein assembly factor BamB